MKKADLYVRWFIASGSSEPFLSPLLKAKVTLNLALEEAIIILGMLSVSFPGKSISEPTIIKCKRIKEDCSYIVYY